MRTLARFVLPLSSLLLVFFAFAGCSSEGTTPSCPTESACMEDPKGGSYWVGYGGSGNDAATGDEPEEETEAGEDAEPTD